MASVSCGAVVLNSFSFSLKEMFILPESFRVDESRGALLSVGGRIFSSAICTGTTPGFTPRPQGQRPHLPFTATLHASNTAWQE